MAPRKLPKHLRTNEVEALLAAAASERDRLVLLVGLLLGLRVSEIAHLRIEHVDLDERTVLVEQGKGSKDRVVPIPVRLVGTLAAWIGRRAHGWLFPSPRSGGPLTERALHKLVVRTARRAGVDRIPVSPHKLRHTYASSALKRGANLRIVQQLLGHASIGTTEIYTHVDVEDLRAAVDRL